ncbi:uncharacterized protein LOC126656093 [Mercurialis annua]|uniref:uncharacterized protein LOC126656093 n=1 Tax=Mercurialis annua TaxID=3986 RepID=UPI00215F6DD9|nr:uncharacterized protein LOC126656093 [Mercurialis annua]
MASLSAKLALTRRGKGEDVYVAAVPLRASKGVAQLVMSAAYNSFNLWDLQHFMVIVKPYPSQDFIVFDFQPEDPESIQTAVAALAGKAVPGTVLVRRMTKLPRRKCWFIGSSKEDDGVDVATKFNNSWDTYLKVGHHDCRHYTNGLVELLTGEEHVLERLRRTDSRSLSHERN